MTINRCKLLAVLLFALFLGGVKFAHPVSGNDQLSQPAAEIVAALQAEAQEAAAESGAQDAGDLNERLSLMLQRHRFTGRIESTLEQRLGRPIDRQLANLGRQLWFDSLTGLNDDNSCSGCHAPSAGFGDTQSIAIGIESNGVVGPNRAGPRNQRRTPMAINAAFFPTLMWNSRFSSRSGDPFDNSKGFKFPAPEGASLSHLPHLLVAQAFIPPTERNEVAGFHFPGGNDDIRREVLRRLNDTPAYRQLFAKSFADVRAGGPITFDMFGLAIAEFEFNLTFANAPIDRFARNQRNAMTDEQKRGALLFFGKAQCVQCHAVAGKSNEMFSDFRQHVIGVPQISPLVTNSVFDGPDHNEDFGLEQVTQNPADRYKFRTSPLRNVALQPTFFHNGAFTTLESAIRHHLDVVASVNNYDPSSLDSDLLGARASMQPVLDRLDSRISTPRSLTDDEFRQLVDFVRNGLLDPRARPENLRRLIPTRVPSGRPVQVFE
ncbi:MAG: cytochrome c peroxidase [Pyrinomonadaceae bacterium]